MYIHLVFLYITILCHLENCLDRGRLPLLSLSNSLRWQEFSQEYVFDTYSNQYGGRSPVSDLCTP